MSVQSPPRGNPPCRPTTKTGAEIVVDALSAHGVDTVFGYTGAAVIPLFDRLYQTDIRVVVPCHEQGGCHMADAYARSSGKTGVIIATSGPGACNLVTGLATAMADSVPLVAITGQVRTDLLGNDAFQEAPITRITQPITKHNVMVKDVRDLAKAMNEAFHIASTGRPGPVLIDLPADVTVASCAVTQTPPVRLPGYRPEITAHTAQIRRAARAIEKAERPVVLAGGGVINADAAAELAAFTRRANLPVAMTLMGLGSYDQSRPESLDMVGMHGAAYANYAIQQADLLIAVGARFDDRVTGNLKRFAPRAKIVHIDIDPASISKNVRADIPIVGDAKAVLAELARHVTYQDRAAWMAQIADWKQGYGFDYDRNATTIKPQHVIEELHRQTGGRAIVATGVGQHQMWCSQHYRFGRARQLITSGGLGTMGFGLPAAIGAQLACPDATVVDIDGDHSFNMTLAELSTAVQHGLPIKVCILNNGYMGMVRQWQELFYGRRYASSYLQNPDYAAVATAMGAVGFTVEKKEEVPQAVERMLAETKPCVVDFHVESEENVWPMVPSGKSLDEMSGLDILERLI